MLTAGWLDVLLLLVFLWQMRAGWVNGLVGSAFALTGLALGAMGAVLAIPLVNPWIAWSMTRPLTVGVIVGILLLLGYSLGRRAGRAIEQRMGRGPLRALNRTCGMALSVVITALALSGVAMSVSNAGLPVISQAMKDSALLRTIDAVVPEPAQKALAKFRSGVINEGIPQVMELLGPATIPPADAEITPQLRQAQRSVVKVTGSAFGCGKSQTGSGFVVTPEKVITNAHVIAGVNRPTVQFSGGAASGEVVYLDPGKDLAVISVPGLRLEPIPLGQGQLNGASTAFAGYPFGGPQQVKKSRLSYQGALTLPDIYHQNTFERQVYQLAADVQPGNSGGPLLSLDGRAVGVIFAKAAVGDGVGYALATEELAPVVNQAPQLNTPVPANPCGAG